MGKRKRHKVLVAGLLAAAIAAIAFTAPLGADYPGPTCASCDYAGPPIEALVHGDLHRFFDTEPIMGGVSLVLRAPFAAVSYIGHHTTRSEYRLGALACLLVLALLAFWVSTLMARAGRPLWQQLLAGGLIVAAPTTFNSLSWGHPEEILGASLCVAAVLLAARARPVAAGVVIGLAIATKPWALLAVLPVLIAARGRRGALLGAAAGTAALFTLPMLIGNPHRLLHLAHVYGVAGPGVTPPDIWWSYGREAGLLITGHGAVPTYVVPGWVWSVAHPLVFALAVVLAAGYWYARRLPGTSLRALAPPRLDLPGALHLLALIMLLRCLLDPTDYSYYHAPFITALVTAEVLGRGRLPYAAGAATAAIWALSELIAPNGASALHAGYLAWALPMGAYLALAVFAPQLLARRRTVAHAPAAA